MDLENLNKKEKQNALNEIQILGVIIIFDQNIDNFFK